MKDSSRLFEPFSFNSSFCPHDQEDLIQRALKLAPLMADKPDLPERSLEEKIESCLVGVVAEYWCERLGFIREDDIHADVRGEGWDLDYLNSRLEIKTIQEASLSQAHKAIAKHNGADYDHLLIFVCNRSTMEFRLAFIFKRGNLSPIYRLEQLT